MLETLHCQHCNAILGKLNLLKLRHVELACDECGEWSVFEPEDDDYVFKTSIDIDEDEDGGA
jgi:phage FluMu protein Com